MSLPAIAAGMSIVSGVMGFAGAITSGNAQRAAANRQAAIDERNKILANQDRIQAINTARIDAEDKRRENRRQLASIRASFGSSGLEVAGTPLDVLADTSIEMALDERRIEYEGQVKGREGALKILGLQESADTSRAAGSSAHKAGVISGFSSLLSSGSDAAANYT